jgi:hypothetical protein
MTSTTPSRNCTTSDIVSRVGASARGKSWGTDMSNQVDVKFPVTSHSYSPCSLGLSATSQQHFSLTTNQPRATSQQYFSLRTNQHQPSATSQTNRLLALANSYLATFDQLSTTFLCFFPRFLSTVFCQTETII